MTKDESILERNDGPWYYEMHEPGFNYRITDFQCALGISQLKKLDSFVARRRSIAEYYNNIFSKDTRFIIPTISHDSNHAYHIYPLRIDFEKLGISKRNYFARMEAKGIRCQVHYIRYICSRFIEIIMDLKQGISLLQKSFINKKFPFLSILPLMKLI